MHEKMQFGLVGAGRIAHAYAEAFAYCQQARLVAVADVRGDAARALAEGFGCQHYDSHQAMLHNCELEDVVVCTPPATHPELCLDLLAHQMHLLCEKPLSIYSPSA
jgi:predicted dehydrogenase